MQFKEDLSQPGSKYFSYFSFPVNSCILTLLFGRAFPKKLHKPCFYSCILMMLCRNSKLAKPWLGRQRRQPFNHLISHKRKVRTQPHKSLSIRHLNLPTFGVHLHKNTACCLWKERTTTTAPKSLRNHFCYLFPRARLQVTHEETQCEGELRCCSGGHGSHSRTHRSEYRLGTAIEHCRKNVLAAPALCCDSEKAHHCYWEHWRMLMP